jgi:hypothetical protein
MSVWGASYHEQKGYTRADMEEPRAAEFARIDFTDNGYASKVVLYIFMGIMDAIWQNYACECQRLPLDLLTTMLTRSSPFADWLMGALSNDAGQLAHLVGFYKAIQSAGAAGIYRMDSQLSPFMTELATSWGLAAAGIVFVIPVIWLRVKDRECLLVCLQVSRPIQLTELVCLQTPRRLSLRQMRPGSMRKSPLQLSRTPRVPWHRLVLFVPRAAAVDFVVIACTVSWGNDCKE